MKNEFSNNRPRRSKCDKSDGLPLVGIFLIGLGSVFMLDRLNLIPFEWHHIIVSWQMLLIFIGLINLFRSHARFSGIILILIGSAFLIPDIIHVPFETRQLIWPLILIIVGVSFVLKARRIRNPHFINSIHESNSDAEKLDEVAIFGGGKRVITAHNLKGGNITAIFGGLEIDLTDADFENQTTFIEVSAIFGGVTLIVKPEWNVQVQVSSILGGFTDKRKVYKNYNPDAKVIVIKGTAIFGGGEVKSY